MKTWQKSLPDYVFMKWDFSKFDKESSIWVKEAFEAKKYAFAADYIRLYALYNYGGIYLDMDVEVLRSFDDFLSLPTMLCYENTTDKRLEVAAFGAEQHSEWVKCCLSYYENRHFINEDGTMNTTVLPIIIRNCLDNKGFVLHDVENVLAASECQDVVIPVFPYDYFSPKSYSTMKIETTNNTYCIHHFAGTWMNCRYKIFNKLKIVKLYWIVALARKIKSKFC